MSQDLGEEINNLEAETSQALDEAAKSAKEQTGILNESLGILEKAQQEKIREKLK